MQRKGGLQLGLNAIVSFIISVMIFGFGIYLIGTFATKAPIDFPDQCVSELSSKLRQNEIFAVCPQTITLSESEMKQGFRIAYAYQNIDSDPLGTPKELFFYVDDPTGTFQSQLSPLIVNPNSDAQGIAILGLVSTPPGTTTSYIKVKLCEEIPVTASTTCINQEKIITITKR